MRIRTVVPRGRERRTATLSLALIVALFIGPATAPSSAQSPTPPPPQPPAGEPIETAVIAVSASGGVDYVGDRETIFKSFYGLGLDTTKPYVVSNLTLRKDNMVFVLKSGTLFLMRPLAGEVTGAAFIGEGEAQMTPPNRMERYMLAKKYGAEVLKESFSEAVFRFSDDSEKILLAGGKEDPAGAASSGRAVEIFKDRNSWYNGYRGLPLEMLFLENRISNLTEQEFLSVDFHSAKHDWISYLYIPADTHEHSLVTSATMGGGGRRYIVPWTTWHKSSDYAPSGHYILLPERDLPRAHRIRRYDLDLNLKDTKTAQWTARVTIEPQVANLRAVRFDMANNGDFSTAWYEDNFYPARLTGVMDEAGKPIPFMHKKDQVLVFPGEPPAAGSRMVLQFQGNAEVIYQLTAESFGFLQIPWFPQYGYLGGRYTFHWTARVPKPFLISGSGRRVREFEDKAAGQNGLEMASEIPVTFPWLIFGRFQKATDTYEGDGTSKPIGMTVHSFPTMTVTITDPDLLELFGLRAPTSFVLNAPLKKVQGFFDEGKEILKLYEKIYGPYPYEELHIAQMAPQLNFGQAPPGFLQLTGAAFMSQAQVESDFIHGFLAHEIAHQWWGNQVGWASGDDEMLSESFAEYASGIFVKEYQGAKRFQRTLEEWRRDAKYSDKEAPIGAANTLTGPNSGDHRTNLLYAKGPYVLHMLRVQLNDDVYMKVMRSVQETYKHQNISTEMLLREVNRVTGSDYTTFFDQWFWDVGVPVFKYSWRSEKQPDGKFLITVHVSQEDKNHVKKVLMPVHIHFKDKEVPPQYKPVVQAEQDIKILSPMAPKDVTLDDDRTLLAEFVKAG